MKKIFLVSCYMIVSVVMVSCTNDEVETTPKTNKQQVSADAPIDGQNGQIPTTPPKP
jgi:hypothetical protein